MTVAIAALLLGSIGAIAAKTHGAAAPLRPEVASVQTVEAAPLQMGRSFDFAPVTIVGNLPGRSFDFKPVTVVVKRGPKANELALGR
jgi:hypothetical protein